MQNRKIMQLVSDLPILSYLIRDTNLIEVLFYPNQCGGEVIRLGPHQFIHEIILLHEVVESHLDTDISMQKTSKQQQESITNHNSMCSVSFPFQFENTFSLRVVSIPIAHD